MRAAATGHGPTSAGDESPGHSRTPAISPSPRCSSSGVVDGIITQNVDGLHQAAGARDVIELHGGP